MSYLAGVAAQHLGLLPTIRPRPMPMFGGPVAPNEVTEDTATPPRPPAAVDQPQPPARTRSVAEPAPRTDRAPAARASGRQDAAERHDVVTELVPAEPVVVTAIERAAGDAVSLGPSPVAARAEPPPAAPVGEPPVATGVLLPRAAAAAAVKPAPTRAPARRAAASAVAQPPEPAPTVQVTIGRVEVRATHAAAPTEAPPSGPRGVMSLDEYVAQRRGSGR